MGDLSLPSLPVNSLCTFVFMLMSFCWLLSGLGVPNCLLGCNHTRYKTTYNPRTRASCQGDARQIQNVTYMFSASSTPLYKATFWRFLLICESTFPVVEGSWFSASVFSFSVRVGIFISPVGLRLHQLPYLEYLNKFLSFPSA